MKKPKDKDRLFIELIKLLEKQPASKWPQIAEEAEVCLATLYNWCYGTTFNPHLNTVMRVARAMGYEVRFEKAKPNLRKVA